MKLLLVIVTVIAVFTVDGLDFSSEPEGHESANQAQLFPAYIEGQSKEHNFLDVPANNNFADIYDSTKNDHQIKEVEKEQHHRKLRRLRCKARNSCVVMGGFCVTNATLCSGRLIAEGCKGTNCQCCVPGTIEAKFDHLEMELQSIKENMKNSNSNLNTELQSLKDNMNNSNSNLNLELQYLKDNMNNSNTNLRTELQSVKYGMNNSSSNLNSEMQSLKVNMNNINSNLNSEMQSLKVNMNNSNANLASELQSLTDNTNNTNSNLNSKLNSMNSNLNSKLASLAKNQGCPEGFFKSSSSNQCFKIFTDLSRNWTDANSKCQSEGLLLAKPYEPIELRSYIVMRYGGKYVWLGARGTGSSVKWDRDAKMLSSNNPMWWSGQPINRTSSSYCLMFLSTENYLKRGPTTPFYSQTCSSYHHALCEYLMD